MKYEKNRKIAGMDEYKVMKVAKIAIIPVIVLALILVIVLADKKNKTKSHKAAETTAATQAVASEALQEEYISNFDDYGLQQNAVEDVNSLVAKYQRAKTTGDAELMYEVFGKQPDEEIEELRASLAEESKAIESYDHTVCYTTAGCEEDSYIVFIGSDLKFHGIDTPAPMLTWAYVYKAPDGNYYMKEPDALNEEEQALLEKVSASEDVKMLDNDMRTRLAQAVINDVKLATLYQMWSDTDDESQTETFADAIHVEIDETTAADENAESTSAIEAEIKIDNEE